jgi:hypothetical protein
MTLAVLAELSEMTHFVREQLRVAGLYMTFYGQPYNGDQDVPY